jgi:hypothetical protein
MVSQTLFYLEIKKERIHFKRSFSSPFFNLSDLVLEKNVVEIS